jgi:quinol monooxygenase YgiN
MSAERDSATAAQTTTSVGDSGLLILIARFEVPAESLPEALQVVAEMDRESASENGCLYYRHAQDVSDPKRLILSEVWTAQDALRAHFRSPHFVAFRAAARRLGIRSEVDQFTCRRVASNEGSHWKTLLRE